MSIYEGFDPSQVPEPFGNRHDPKHTDTSRMTEAEALDEAARAAGWPNGWGEASRFAPNNLFNAIRAHAKTIIENAALKAENERLREALGDAARGFDEANIPIAKLTGSRSIMVDTFAARARAALKEISNGDR